MIRVHLRVPNNRVAQQLPDTHCGSGHDVEVSGLRRKESPVPVHLEQDGDARRDRPGQDGLVNCGGARRAVAGHIGRTRATIASTDRAGSACPRPTGIAQKTVLRITIGGSAGFRTMIAFPRAPLRCCHGATRSPR